MGLAGNEHAGSAGEASVAAAIGRLAALRGQVEPPVRHEARRALLNVIGVMLGVDEIATCDVVASAGEPGDVSVPGRTERLDRYWAARVAAVSAHVDDFDDTHLATVIHPSAPAIGALIGLGLAGIDSGTLLDAMAIGIEAQLRVGMAMTPWHYERGWHITGTCGVIGAAVTAGVAEHRAPREIVAAVGLAARMYVGHREGFGSMVKSLNAGAAAANGLLAHDLAGGAVPAGAAAFEAEGGYFAMLAGTWEPQWLRADDIGHRWLTLDNSYKPYPCGVVAHPAIEAAIGLEPLLGLGRNPERLAELAAVEVRCHPLVPDLMGKLQPRNGLEGRFSAIHGVAVGLVDGKAALSQFSDERVRAADVAAVRDLIHLKPDPGCGRASVTVRLLLKDGRYFDSHVENVVSSIERPLTDQELTGKFTDLVTPAFGAEASASLLDAIWNLGEGTEPEDLARVLAGLPARPPKRRAVVPRPNEAADTASARLAAFVAGAAPWQLPGPIRTAASQALSAVSAEAAQAPAGDRALEYRAMEIARAATARSPGQRADLSLPAAAAVAALGADDDTAVTAVAAGLEACARIKAALNLDEHPEWLESGSLGQVGAALAAARVLGLDSTRTLAALGIAATMTSGLAAPPESGMAWLESAKAASDGVLAALLAHAGMDGPAAPVEGHRGMSALLAAGHCDTAVLTADSARHGCPPLALACPAAARRPSVTMQTQMT